jgi:GNAT superfamily N-acetyltransferase
MSDIIFGAATASDYDAFARLIRQYVEWCRDRYQDDAWFIDQVLSQQSWERELENLSVSYGPPNGRTFLARHEGQICGCGAYRRRSSAVCEMKRLFVLDQFHGKGYGRKLCEEIIRSARNDRFKIMRLDTANLMTEAITMYQSFGFRDGAPYNVYPENLMRYIVFMEMPLADN